METLHNQNVILSAPREIVKDSLAQVLEKLNSECMANSEKVRFVILTSSQSRKPSDFTEESLKMFADSKKIVKKSVKDGFKLNICKVPKGTKTAEWISTLNNIFTSAYGLLEQGSEIFNSTLNEIYTEADAFKNPENSKNISLKEIYNKLVKKAEMSSGDDKERLKRLADRLFFFTLEELKESICFGEASDDDIDSMCETDTVTLIELEESNTETVDIINQYAMLALFKSAKNNPNTKEKTILVLNDADRYIRKNDYLKPFFDMASGFGLYYVFTTDNFKFFPDFVIANTHQILQ